MKHLVLEKRTGDIKEEGTVFMVLKIHVYLYTYFVASVLVCVRERRQGQCAHTQVVQRIWEESLCERACACLNEHVCEKGEKDDRGPGGTETSVADSTPFSFYYQIIHDKQLWRLAKVRQAG